MPWPSADHNRGRLWLAAGFGPRGGAQGSGVDWLGHRWGALQAVPLRAVTAVEQCGSGL